jgi:hypothetical protein
MHSIMSTEPVNNFYQSISATNVSNYIDETVVAAQKKRAVEMLDNQKRQALEQSQRLYEVQKTHINFDADHKLEMAKAGIEAKRLQEIMQIEQHFAQERMELEQQIQQQKISIEQQALQLEQQAKQQQLAKQQYEQMMKYQHQMSTTSAQLPQYMSTQGSFSVPAFIRQSTAGADQSINASFVTGSQFTLPNYSYYPPQQHVLTTTASPATAPRTSTPASAKTEA